MSTQLEKRERIRRHWRKPKAVLRALGKYADNDTDAYHKEQILEWLNAAAPIAVVNLINDAVGDDPVMRQRASIDILDRVVGRPKPQSEGSGLPLQGGGRKIEIIITDPQGPQLNEVLEHENVTA